MDVVAQSCHACVCVCVCLSVSRTGQDPSPLTSKSITVRLIISSKHCGQSLKQPQSRRHQKACMKNDSKLQNINKQSFYLIKQLKKKKLGSQRPHRPSAPISHGWRCHTIPFTSALPSCVTHLRPTAPGRRRRRRRRRKAHTTPRSLFMSYSRAKGLFLSRLPPALQPSI